jgi:putative FmdB family regulatory protein
MPLFEYRCNRCLGSTEVLVRPGDPAALVQCASCGSSDVARAISRFCFKPARAEKYSEDFREKTLPFLRSRPGARELLAEGGESEEAKAFAVTERIGEGIDRALENQVFRQR